MPLTYPMPGGNTLPKTNTPPIYGTGLPKPQTTVPKATTPTATTPQAPTIYGSNTNWATGQTAWDPKNIYGTNQKTGMMSTPQPNYQITMAGNPQASFQADPGNTDVASAMPNAWATSNTYQESPLPNTDVATAMPDPTSGAAASYAQPQGYGSPPGLNTQYATLDNIQPYMNPYLDQIISKGTNAIEHSAAGKGLFGSSGNVNDIGDWASRSQSNAFNDARSAFTADRNYMTDQYWNTDGANRKDYWDNENHQWDIYKYGDADFKGRMQDYYNQNNGLVQTGQNAAGNVGTIYGNVARAIAGLLGTGGDVGAAAAVNGGNSNSNLIQGLLGGLLSSYGGGK